MSRNRKVARRLCARMEVRVRDGKRALAELTAGDAHATLRSAETSETVACQKVICETNAAKSWEQNLIDRCLMWWLDMKRRRAACVLFSEVAGERR
jgi:hypothetical protein